MRCPRCGDDARFTVNVFVDAPARMFHRMSKQNLKHRDAVITGVDWGEIY